MCWQEGVHLLYGFEKLLLVKHLMRGAAEMVRDFCQNNEQNTPWVKAQTLRTIARVVWNQDWRLATAMIDRDTFVAKYLRVDGFAVHSIDFQTFF